MKQTKGYGVGEGGAVKLDKKSNLCANYIAGAVVL